MEKVQLLREFLTEIADVIRAKKGTTDLINAKNFKTELEELFKPDGRVVITKGGVHDITPYAEVLVSTGGASLNPNDDGTYSITLDGVKYLAIKDDGTVPIHTLDKSVLG